MQGQVISHKYLKLIVLADRIVFSAIFSVIVCHEEHISVHASDVGIVFHKGMIFESGV